jgi:oligoendopeptidase F
MHSWYSQRDQLFQDHGYPIFLAEVASTFNEALLTHYLLEKAETSAMRAYLLDRQIESIRSVLFRQTMLAEFERDTHALEEQGGPITLEAFQRSYGALLKDYFGPRFTLDSALEIECLRIPHFYSAFYVYKYATGLSAALTLAQQVLAGADVRPYLRFLSSGGSKFPLETLLDAGVDMRSPEPIEQALNLFGKRVTELRELLRNGVMEVME